MISIIIATYLRDEYLLRTLEDLSRQMEVDFEIIVVDQTPRVDEKLPDDFRKFLKRKNFKWIRQSLPSPNKARNLGVSMARGDILLFVDDDVYIEDEHFLKKHSDNYPLDNALSAVCGREILDGSSLMAYNQAVRHKTPESQALYFPRNSLKRMNVYACSTCNFSIRRATFIELGGLDENFKGTGYTDDADLALRIAKNSGKIIFDPAAMVIHRRAVNGGCRIGGGAKYPGWHQYVSPFIFAFRYLKGKELCVFILGNALRKSLFLKYNVLRPFRWPKVFLDTMLAIYYGISLSKKPITSIFTRKEYAYGK